MKWNDICSIGKKHERCSKNKTNLFPYGNYTGYRKYNNTVGKSKFSAIRHYSSS